MMKKTFRINDDENQDYTLTEREVNEWKVRRRNHLQRRREIHTIDTLTITEGLIQGIMKCFTERSPGSSGITRTLLLNAPSNIHRI